MAETCICWLKASMVLTLSGRSWMELYLRGTSEELVMFCILIWVPITWMCSDVKIDWAILCLCIFLHVCYISVKRQKKKFMGNIYSKTKWPCIPMKLKIKTVKGKSFIATRSTRNGHLCRRKQKELTDHVKDLTNRRIPKQQTGIH